MQAKWFVFVLTTCCCLLSSRRALPGLATILESLAAKHILLVDITASAFAVTTMAVVTGMLELYKQLFDLDAVTGRLFAVKL